MNCSIRIQAEDFDMAREYQVLRNSDAGVGAVVTFSGLVRDFESSQDQSGQTMSIDALTLQHYPGMTEKLLQDIAQQADQRWRLIAVTLIHRIGRLLPTEQIVFVGVASQHRSDAFEAAQFLMDYLKTQATFWKQVSQDGQHYWIDSRDSDLQAACRWQISEND